MALKPCINATKNLNDDDVQSVLDAYQSYKDAGMPERESVEAAVNDVIASVETERTEYLDLIKEQHPDAGFVERRAEGVKRKERRNQKARDLYDQLTKEELVKQILAHELTGIKGRKAFVIDVQDAAQIASIDADSLKWVNDNMSPDHGDALLQSVADALEAETDSAYHISGDEFYVLGDTREEIEDAVTRASERLANAEIVAVKPDGTPITLKGLNITTGYGVTKDEADTNLKQQKVEREKAGQRAARGEPPPGAVIEPAGEQPGEGEAAETVAAESTEDVGESSIADRTAGDSEPLQPPADRVTLNSDYLSRLFKTQPFLDEFDGMLDVKVGPHSTRKPTDLVKSGSATSKSGLKSMLLHAKSLRNIIGRDPFLEQGFSSLDAKTKRSMLAHVRALGKNREVLDSVIKFIPVDVVNDLGRFKLTPNMFFNNHSVLKPSIAKNLNKNIPTGVDVPSTLVRAITLAGAEVGSGRVVSDLVWPSTDDGTAGGAVNINLWHGYDDTRSDRGDPFFRRKRQRSEPGAFRQRDSVPSEAPTESISRENLERLTQRIQRDYKGTQPINFIVREKQADAFGANSVDEQGRIKGGFYAGTNDVLLIAENISDVDDAMTVIRHEVFGHYGMRQLLNKDGEYDKILSRVYAARDGELKDLYDWVAKNYPDLDDKRLIADEMLARAAETKVKADTGLLKRIYDAIILLINKLGLSTGPITREDTDVLIRLAEENLERKIEPVIVGDPAEAVRSRLEDEPAKSIIDSPKFKAWFGDSKVVDNNGEPLVVYHGTSSDFSVFDDAMMGKATHAIDTKQGSAFFFTTQPGFAGMLAFEGGTVMPSYLSIQNPYTRRGIVHSPTDIADAIKKAKKNGNDGVVYEAEKKGLIDTGTFYIAFNPTQIKSAVGNRGTFDPRDPSILYRRAEVEPTRGNLGMPDERLYERFVRWFQNDFNRVKRLQQHIEATGGDVRYDSDVYLAEELSSGKIASRLDSLDKEYMRPLLEEIDETGTRLEELDDYLMMKHARERNEWIASHRPDMPDGGSGITNAQTAEYFAQLDPETIDKFDSMANKVYAVNDKNLDDLVAGGHLTQETIDEWRQRWNFYVPLKGKVGEEGRPGPLGKGYSIAGAAIRQAMGRGIGNLAESPTAHSFAAAETTIVRTEKTAVGQALISLIRANPDENLWTINKRTFQRFTDLYGEPFEGWMEEPKALIEDFDYHPTMAIVDGKKQVVYRVDPRFKQRDDVFSVMEQGQELVIGIKDPVLAEQLKRMNSAQLNAVVAGFSKVNRFLAMINTALNPEFVITNFERDLQTAMINLSGEQSARMAANVAKGIPGAARGIWQETFETTGTSEWRDVYREMREEGGTIGFFGLEDIDTKVKNVHRKLNIKHGVVGRTQHGILKVRDVVLDANLAVENAARLSAYKVARDQWVANGMPAAEARAKAASLSKNLTVNFNRKGELAPLMNSLYLFYNASIQGSFRIFTALSHPRVRKIVGGIAAVAMMNMLWNREFGGDDEDDIPYWDKISDYTKQTNIIIMVPGTKGEYIKWRLPYGYNAFWYAGTSMGDTLFGSKSATQSAMNMLSAVMNAYNPIQGADLVDTLAPTITKPVLQDYRNLNFMGSPIKPDFPFDRYDRPESQKYFKSTNPQLRDFMVMLNEMSGGDETHPGFIDVSPETVSHYVGWLTGGAGMTVTRTAGTLTNLVTGQEVESKNVPFVRTVTGGMGTHFDTQRFYDAVKQVEAVKAQLKLYKGTDLYGQYRAQNYEVNKLAFHVPKYKRKIKKLRDDRDKAYVDGDIELANQLREDIRVEMMEFSTRYDDAIAQQ